MVFIFYDARVLFKKNYFHWFQLLKADPNESFQRAHKDPYHETEAYNFPFSCCLFNTLPISVSLSPNKTPIIMLGVEAMLQAFCKNDDAISFSSSSLPTFSKIFFYLFNTSTFIPHDVENLSFVPFDAAQIQKQ